MIEVFLEDLTTRGLNMYEAVIAAAREARRINERRRRMAEADWKVKATTLALQKLMSGPGRCIYPKGRRSSHG